MTGEKIKVGTIVVNIDVYGFVMEVRSGGVRKAKVVYCPPNPGVKVEKIEDLCAWPNRIVEGQLATDADIQMALTAAELHERTKVFYDREVEHVRKSPRYGHLVPLWEDEKPSAVRNIERQIAKTFPRAVDAFFVHQASEGQPVVVAWADESIKRKQVEAALLPFVRGFVHNGGQRYWFVKSPFIKVFGGVYLMTFSPDGESAVPCLKRRWERDWNLPSGKLPDGATEGNS